MRGWSFPLALASSVFLGVGSFDFDGFLARLGSVVR